LRRLTLPLPLKGRAVTVRPWTGTPNWSTILMKAPVRV
jgi:hypothetical protein